MSAFWGKADIVFAPPRRVGSARVEKEAGESNFFII